MNETSLTLLKRIRACPLRVYKTCTDPALVAQWWSPARLDVEHVEIDLRIGGRFTIRMSGAEGSYMVEGHYQEIVPGERLSMTWKWVEMPAGVDLGGDSSRVTFSFEPNCEGTLLTLVHERLVSGFIADDHRKGWTEALAKLDHLHAQEAVYPQKAKAAE